MKAICGDLIDRISDLPSNVIDGILEHLNILDLVRTSILSRKWRHMWTSVPQLKFKTKFFKKCKHLGDSIISRIITEVLMVHNGPIYKFILDTSDSRYKISDESLNKWILFLSRRGIKYLELASVGKVLKHMPSFVFSCKELVYFKSSGFSLVVPSNCCGFTSLLDLQLHLISFKSSGALDSLISSCPILEKLLISYCSGFDCIDFSAPTLKVLCIISEEIKPICLDKANNLIDLKLVTDTYPERFRISDLLKGLPPRIQRLTMASGYNKILSFVTIPMALQRTFSSLNYLKLSFIDLNEREFLYIVRVLKSASNLVQLVIKSFSHVLINQVPYTTEELECSGCCLSQLKTVDIEVGASFEQAMRLIRLLLANSPSLETLTFYVDDQQLPWPAALLLSISRDLLQMQRASQRAEVEFRHRNMFNCVHLFNRRRNMFG